MIQMQEYVDPTRGYWMATCPLCTYPIEFFISTPMYCPCCKAAIPPLYMMVDDDPDFAIETRLAYYKKGDAWIKGDF